MSEVYKVKQTASGADKSIKKDDNFKPQENNSFCLKLNQAEPELLNQAEPEL